MASHVIHSRMPLSKEACLRLTASMMQPWLRLFLLHPCSAVPALLLLPSPFAFLRSTCLLTGYRHSTLSTFLDSKQSLIVQEFIMSAPVASFKENNLCIVSGRLGIGACSYDTASAGSSYKYVILSFAAYSTAKRHLYLEYIHVPSRSSRAVQLL